MKLTEKLYNGFLTFFGDIKVFKFPMFIIYDPGSYKIKGEDIRQVINLVKPGDILIHGYINYLDGYFIPGFFSHAGLYLGKIEETDSVELKPEQKEHFKTGEQMVIHSMAEGVFMEDVINFCRCDYMVILRRKKEIEQQETLTFDKLKPLQYLGLNYDFKFDFSNKSKLSCTELVYQCYVEIMHLYEIKVTEKKALLFIKKKMIAPDDFVNSKLDVTWKSPSISDKIFARIRNRSTLAKQ
jgi:hypothetical protein